MADGQTNGRTDIIGQHSPRLCRASRHNNRRIGHAFMLLLRRYISFVHCMTMKRLNVSSNFLPSDRPAMLVFLTSGEIPTGSPLPGASKANEIRKIAIFNQYLVLFSETIQDRAVVTVEYMRSIELYHFQ